MRSTRRTTRKTGRGRAFARLLWRWLVQIAQFAGRLMPRRRSRPARRVRPPRPVHRRTFLRYLRSHPFRASYSLVREPEHAGLGGRPAASRSTRASLAGPGLWLVVLLAAVLLAWQFLGTSSIPLATGLIGAGIELRWRRSAHDNPPWRGFVGGILGASIGAAAVYLVGSLAAVGQTLLRVLLLGIVAAFALRAARWLGALRQRR